MLSKAIWQGGIVKTVIVCPVGRESKVAALEGIMSDLAESKTGNFWLLSLILRHVVLPLNRCCLHSPYTPVIIHLIDKSEGGTLGPLRQARNRINHALYAVCDCVLKILFVLGSNSVAMTSPVQAETR